jgi:hypothetical protein
MTMIDPVEFRIGNYVELKNSGIIQVNSDNIGDILNNPSIFSPIPLTPEILEACNGTQVWDDDAAGGIWFAEMKENTETELHDWKTIRFGETLFAIKRKHPANIWYSVDTLSVEMTPISNYSEMYLHRLQNIIHAMCGCELDVALPQLQPA